MAFARKSLIAKIFIALIVTQAFINIQNSPSLVQMAMAKHEIGMNPGMQLRVRSQQLESFKKAMQNFFPHYLNVDYDLPKTYSYEVDMFFDLLTWDVEWTNITYAKAELDIKDIMTKFIRHNDR